MAVRRDDEGWVPLPSKVGGAVGAIDYGDAQQLTDVAAERFSELVDRLLATAPVARAEIFGVRVPLRVCPLGAHIDHQGGTVTGLAIDRYVLMAAAATPDSTLRVESLDFPGAVEVDLTVTPAPRVGEWGDYVRAALTVLQAEFTFRGGLRAIVGGELPGAGLSSSAAVLLTYLLALAERERIELSRHQLVDLAQLAENSYIGVASGRLDPAIMLFALEGHLTCVDCSDFTVAQVPASASGRLFRVLVAYSGASRSLASTGFNFRVDECREAARQLLELAGQTPPAIPLLSAVDAEIFAEMHRLLPADLRSRAAHFFGETNRVREGRDAWRRGDLERFGELMTESGESSIVNYQCGTPPLVTLFELLRDAPGVYGSRFSGAGFGGSCVALAEPSACDEIVAAVASEYRTRYPDLASRSSFAVCGTGGPAQLFRR